MGAIRGIVSISMIIKVELKMAQKKEAERSLKRSPQRILQITLGWGFAIIQRQMLLVKN